MNSIYIAFYYIFQFNLALISFFNDIQTKLGRFNTKTNK